MTDKSERDAGIFEWGLMALTGPSINFATGRVGTTLHELTSEDFEQAVAGDRSGAKAYVTEACARTRGGLRGQELTRTMGVARAFERLFGDDSLVKAVLDKAARSGVEA